MGLKRSLQAVFLATAMLTVTAVAPASAAVLYDQYDNAGTSNITSQDFEAGLNNNDAQAADDFVVPAGQSWAVTGVDVDGQGNPPASFHVVFYENTAGNLPGAIVATRNASTFSGGPAAGDAVISVSPSVSLSPGTYWVSVQARADSAAGQWYWQNRTVTSNSGAAWQNPGNGFGTGCTTWGRRIACFPGQPGPDQVFRLNGSAFPIYTTQTSTGAPLVPGTDDIGTHGDDVATAITFPFPVRFAGQTRTGGSVSSNGTLQFATASPTQINSCLPGATLGSAIVPLWDDLRTDNGGSLPAGRGIFTAVTGTAPHRTFVIEWRAAYFASPASAANFEIQLREDTPIVTVIYGDVSSSNAPSSNGASATAGVQATGAGPVTEFACNTPGSLTNGLRVDYIPNARNLAVSRTGTGTGTVTSNDERLSCGATCSRLFAGDNPVTLTANPGGGSVFTGWSGGGCSGTDPCTINMDSDKAVTANFAVARTLTITKSGSGGGSVTSNPGGIDCGATCSASYADGTSVTLTPDPAAGSTFAGWSGGGCSGTGTCVVAMGSDQAVSAAFDVVPGPPPPGTPNTEISKAKINQKKNSAKFTFAATDAPKAGAAAFQCQLNRKRKKAKPFTDCTSPKTYKHLKPGKYTFSVRALSAANADPSPATQKFRIKP